MADRSHELLELLAATIAVVEEAQLNSVSSEERSRLEELHLRLTEDWGLIDRKLLEDSTFLQRFDDAQVDEIASLTRKLHDDRNLGVSVDETISLATDMLTSVEPILAIIGPWPPQ